MLESYVFLYFTHWLYGFLCFQILFIERQTLSAFSTFFLISGMGRGAGLTPQVAQPLALASYVQKKRRIVKMYVFHLKKPLLLWPNVHIALYCNYRRTVAVCNRNQKTSIWEPVMMHAIIMPLHTTILWYKRWHPFSPSHHSNWDISQ